MGLDQVAFEVVADEMLSADHRHLLGNHVQLLPALRRPWEGNFVAR
jgi:hypothetical protein